ncbi:hypothetical protein NW752_000230 [Fusarium irregulare]|nr:hypothetical protein NW752_000230 [Fusarium irregulare]
MTTDGVVAILRFRETSDIAPLAASLKVTYRLSFSQDLPNPVSRELMKKYKVVASRYRLNDFGPDIPEQLVALELLEMYRFGELEPLRNSMSLKAAGHIMAENETDAVARDRNRLDTLVVNITAPEAGADNATILVIGTTATMVAVAQQFNTMGHVVNERDVLGPKAW